MALLTFLHRFANQWLSLPAAGLQTSLHRFLIWWPSLPVESRKWPFGEIFVQCVLKEKNMYTICPYVLFSVNWEMKQWQEIRWSYSFLYSFLYSGKLGGQVGLTLYRWWCILVKIMAHGELEAVQEVDKIFEKVTGILVKIKAHGELCRKWTILLIFMK